MKKTEARQLVADLWKAGLKKEARELFEVTAALTDDEAEIQTRIFSIVLSEMGVSSSRLQINQKSNTASFVVSGLSLISMGSFVTKLLKKLQAQGNRNYSIDKIERKTPVRVFVKM